MKPQDEYNMDPLSKKQKIIIGLAIICFYIAHDAIVVWIFS